MKDTVKDSIKSKYAEYNATSTNNAPQSNNTSSVTNTPIKNNTQYKPYVPPAPAATITSPQYVRPTNF